MATQYIFNKSDNGIEEMQQYFSHISGMLEFVDMQNDILLAQEELYKYVGKNVITRALNHYNSDDYHSVVDEDASGSAGEEAALIQLNDGLVEHVQMAVCFLGYREYALNNDATHTKTGRVSRMDKDQDEVNTQLIDRDDRALLRKAHKAIDRLIGYIDENQLEEWIASEIYKTCRELIIWNADIFERYHPIERDRRLFLLLVPMLRRIQVNEIAPTIGTERMAQLMAYIKAKDTSAEASGSGGDSEEMELLADKASFPLAYKALAAAYKELPVALFPESMARQFWNAGNGIAFVTLRDNVINAIAAEGREQMRSLMFHLDSMDAQDEGSEITDDTITTIAERMDDTNKFVRV